MNMFTWLKNWWTRTLPTCKKCGSSDVKHDSNYIRGWNRLCDQMYGDRGTFCYNCHHIEWDTPYEEHIKTLPEWCKPYKKD